VDEDSTESVKLQAAMKRGEYGQKQAFDSLETEINSFIDQLLPQQAAGADGEQAHRREHIKVYRSCNNVIQRSMPNKTTARKDHLSYETTSSCRWAYLSHVNESSVQILIIIQPLGTVNTDYRLIRE
jgi:hypothetical protein